MNLMPVVRRTFMRNLLIAASILFLSVSTADAGITGYKGPVEYLGALPQPPGSGCQVTAETIDKFKYPTTRMPR
jgi:hypothetical protein